MVILDNHVIHLYLEAPDLTLRVHTGRSRPPPDDQYAVHERGLRRILRRRPTAEEFREIFETEIDHDLFD